MAAQKYLSSEKRRGRTVEAVIALCSKADPATITTERIARQMKVTQGALFRHFSNKAAIWKEVIGWVAGRILNRVATAGDGHEDPLEALEAVFMSHVDFIVRHPGVPRVLMGQLQGSGATAAKQMVRSLLESYRERLVALLRQAREKGKLRPGLSLEAAAFQFVGTLQGLVLQSLIAGDVRQIAAQAPAAFDIYLNGIRAGGGGKQ